MVSVEPGAVIVVIPVMTSRASTADATFTLAPQYWIFVVVPNRAAQGTFEFEQSTHSISPKGYPFHFRGYQGKSIEYEPEKLVWQSWVRLVMKMSCARLIPASAREKTKERSTSRSWTCLPVIFMLAAPRSLPRRLSGLRATDQKGRELNAPSLRHREAPLEEVR